MARSSTLELVRIDGAKLEIGDGATADVHVEALPPIYLGLPRSRRRRASAARRRPSRPRRSSRRRAASSASARSGRWPSHSGSTRASTRRTATSASSRTCAPTRPPWPGCHGRGPRRDPGPLRRGVHDAEGSCVQDEVQGRPGGARVDPPDELHARPGLAGSQPGPEELRLYRLVWQRAIASQMAPRELETTTVELEAGRYELRANATRTLFDGFARVYTEGRDDGAEEDAEGALPPLAEGDSTDVVEATPTQHFTEPPPRYTEATLIKALEEHGIGRLDLRGHDLHDPRPGLRPRGGAPPPARAHRRDRHRPARGALRRLRGRRVHRPDGGGARRGRAGERPWVPLLRDSTAAPRPRRREAPASSGGGTSRPRNPTRSAPSAIRW